VWLFYVVRWGETWSTSRIQAKVSRDGAQTWSESFVVSEREGMMVRGRPIVLASGEYLLPAYYETGYDPELVAPDSGGWFLRWDPKLAQWIEAGRIRSMTAPRRVRYASRVAGSVSAIGLQLPLSSPER